MPGLDPLALAREFVAAYASAGAVPVPPSSRDPGFDLNAAYAVEAELARLRLESGHKLAGRKVGYANKAMWRILKLETLVWAHMYDDTVHYAAGNSASLPLASFFSPKIEPEIVFKLKKPLAESGLDAAMVLDAVEAMAVGFEIIDCPYPDWKLQPADFVAAFGLHRALIVGEPQSIDPTRIPELVDQLPRFKLKLFKNGELIEEGSGKNSLRSPVLCLAELSSAILRQSGAEPLSAGELISTGTLTNAQPIAGGETWEVTCEGIALPNLTLRLT
jgi:2-oxo-3-hexenedioate decarboxylase